MSRWDLCANKGTGPILSATYFFWSRIFIPASLDGLWDEGEGKGRGREICRLVPDLLRIYVLNQSGLW